MFYGVMAFGLTWAVRWGYHSLYHHPYLAVEYLTVEGGQLRTQTDIRKDLNWVLGKNIVALNLSEIHHQVATNPFVAEATVSAELPDRLNIRIFEHQPEALIRLSQGILAVNRDGEIIGPYEKFPEGLDLPVLDGLIGLEDQGAQITKGLAALATIRQTSLLFWDNLETLDLGDAHNMVARLRNVGAPIYLGSEIVPENLTNYLSIADRIQSDYAHLAYIELGFPGQIAILPKSTEQE
jgi:hypothetical protein